MKKFLRSNNLSAEIYLFNYVFKRVLRKLLTDAFVDLFLEVAQNGLDVSANGTISIRAPMESEDLAAANRLIDLG